MFILLCGIFTGIYSQERQIKVHETTQKPEAEHTHFGYRTVRSDNKERLVHDVFAKVASRYDLMNDLMSGGMHRLWKDAMVSWLNPPGSKRQWRHVDVAGGTADIAMRVQELAGENCRTGVLDINPHMLL